MQRRIGEWGCAPPASALSVRVQTRALRALSTHLTSDRAGLLRLIAGLALCGLAAAEESGAVILKKNNDEFSIPAFVIGVR